MRANRIIRWTEGLLWLIAASTVAFCAFAVGSAAIYQSYLNREFDNALQEHQKNAELQSVVPTDSFERDPTEPATVAETVPAPVPLPKPLATPSEPYLGRLHIARLGISTMILDGVDDRVLRLGIGHIPGTALPGQPGNIGIAGHRDTFFRGLSGIHNGDRIFIETVHGEYQYVVFSVIVVDPNAVGVLEDIGQPALTLVTCYPFNLVGPASRRMIVRASLEP